MVKIEAYPTTSPRSDDLFGPQLSPIIKKLFDAVTKCQYKKLKYLIQTCSVKLTTRNQYGQTVLIVALHIQDDQRRFRMFRYLLKQGASPFAKDTMFDRNCLLWACVLTRCPEVQLLLNEYAGEMDIRERDKDGMTALHHAVAAGSLEIVRMLIDIFYKYRLSVDVPDRLGLTPYMQARRLGHYDIALVLKNEGRASTHRRDPFMFKTGTEWSQIGKKEREEYQRDSLLQEMAWTKIWGRVPRLAKQNGSPLRHSGRSVTILPQMTQEEGEDKGSGILSESFPDGKSTCLSNRSLPDHFHDRASENTQTANKLTYSLMDMAENGRRVEHFHKSQSVDSKTDTSVLENIGSLLNILVEQSSESFRKSVEKPVVVHVKPPPPKSRVSSLAIVMGKKRGDRTRKSRLDRRESQKSRLAVIDETRPVSKSRKGSRRNVDIREKPKTSQETVRNTSSETSLLQTPSVLPEIKITG